MLNGWEMKEGFMKTQEMKNKLNPVYQAHTVIYGCKKIGIYPKELEPFKDINVNWIERYYPYGLQLVPRELREGLIKKYGEYGIETMSGTEMQEILEFNILK